MSTRDLEIKQVHPHHLFLHQEQLCLLNVYCQSIVKDIGSVVSEKGAVSLKINNKDYDSMHIFQGINPNEFSGLLSA